MVVGRQNGGAVDGMSRPRASESHETLSPKELSEVIGLSESTLKRWVDSGVVSAVKTPGGHRRIPRAEAIRLIRESNLPILRPESLGLPELALVRESPTTPGLEGLRLFELLRDGEERVVRGLLLSQFLSGRSVIEIADGPVREAMQRIGELWRHTESGIFLEHRATEILTRALTHLQSVVPAPAPDAPLAIGCSPTGDPYVLPTMIAALVLEASGFRTQNLGHDLPLASLAIAAEQTKPVLVWLSISSTSDLPGIGAEIAALADRLAARSIALVVGGRSRGVAPQHPAVQLAMSMGELVAFAQNVVAKR